MTDEHIREQTHPFDINEVSPELARARERLEPGSEAGEFVEPSAIAYSAAVSLKRIADSLEFFAGQYRENKS